MTVSVMVAFLFFTVSMSLTPGAGNLTLLGISNRYGFLAALPFVAGTAFGVLIVFGGASAGLVSFLTTYPELYITLKYLGAAYLLYVAWGIATMNMEQSDNTDSRAGFVSGTLVQILNPKAWIAAMTVFTQFTSDSGDYLCQVITVISAFLVIMTLCVLVWAYFGSMLKQLISKPQQMMWVNRSLGVTLAITVLFMCLEP